MAGSNKDFSTSTAENIARSAAKGAGGWITNPAQQKRDMKEGAAQLAKDMDGAVARAVGQLTNRKDALDRQIDGSTNDPTHVHFGGNPGSSTGQ